MKTLRLSRQQIEAWGGVAVCQEAEKLVQRGAVLRAEWNEPFIEGAVARATGEMRTRCKVLPNGLVENLCPCYMNREQGLVCSHVTALALALLKRQTDPLREQKYQEEQRLARLAAALPDDRFVRREKDGRPARLRVALPKTWRDDFENGWIALRCEFEDESGAFAVNTPDPVALSPEDGAILSVLEDIANGAPARFLPVKPGDFVSLLPLLAKSGGLRVEGGAEIACSTEPRAPFLHAAFDEKTGEITLHLKMEGDETPQFIVHLNQGHVLTGGALHPMAGLLPLP
ncbi:MAG: hypothetical protein FWF96_07525, partial [Kiritimatiellaeota bacterium]|nr:hypothetical protein [Kiritimatiellota bacterium]